MLTIKDHHFTPAAPLLAVPVTAASAEEIKTTVAALGQSDTADLIEWRIDHFTGAGDPARVASLLRELSPLAGEKLLLSTVRTAAEGGRYTGDENAYLSLLRALSVTGASDLLDVEADRIRDLSSFFFELQKNGARIIASHHEFQSTPPEAVMEETLLRMIAAGADIAKLAVMPKTKADVLSLLSVTERVSTAYPDTPLITISMGKTGAISRVMGGAFGSSVTFGADGEKSAPGQPDAKTLRQMLTLLSKLYTRERN